MVRCICNAVRRIGRARVAPPSIAPNGKPRRFPVIQRNTVSPFAPYADFLPCVPAQLQILENPHMFSPKSPFLNFPSNLDRRQAFYLDGIRHAAEIIDLSFSRLSDNLTALVRDVSESKRPNGYAIYYLDAWAFVDAVDRFIALWKLQPNADLIPYQWSPRKLADELMVIRKIRNVSDHIAQRADEIISSNTAAFGELSWVTVLSESPLEIKSCLIRPGFLPHSLDVQINVPEQRFIIKNHSGNILLKAHTYTANLSNTYSTIMEIIEYAESSLKGAFKSQDASKSIGGDLIATCNLQV